MEMERERERERERDRALGLELELERAVAFDFVGRHPVEAARLLERAGEDDVATLLETLETKDLARVLAALSPPVSAAQLARLPTARAVAVIDALGVERGAVLMRRLDEGRLRDILAALPEADRRAVEKLLLYPEGTAGALMDPRAASFHRERKVHEVIDAIRTEWRHLRYYVFVLDDEHRLVGVLSLRELVAAPANATLASVMHRPVESLSARASTSAILKHAGWKRFPQLPVVDESDRLLGVFRYRTFQALRAEGHDEDAPGPLGLALALSELFWLGAAGVFRGLGSERSSESGSATS